MPPPPGGGSIHAIGFGIIRGVVETNSLLDVGKIEVGDAVLEGGKSGVTVAGEGVPQTIKITDNPVRNHCNGFKDRG